jgi:hypothetical protein
VVTREEDQGVAGVSRAVQGGQHQATFLSRDCAEVAYAARIPRLSASVSPRKTGGRRLSSSGPTGRGRTERGLCRPRYSTGNQNGEWVS